MKVPCSIVHDLHNTSHWQIFPACCLCDGLSPKQQLGAPKSRLNSNFQSLGTSVCIWYKHPTRLLAKMHLAIFVVLSIITTFAAADMWAWEAGSATASTTHTPAPHDAPMARCCSQSWTVGNSLWVFGGAGVVTNGSEDGAFLGDLWEYRISDRVWVYHGGSKQANPPGSARVPSGRTYAATWMRRGRNGVSELWMWGGFGVQFDGDENGGNLNDTWSLDTTTLEWTHHPLSAGAAAPPGRNWANFWATNSGDVAWVMSGANGYNPICDMWRYEVASNTWAMVYNLSDNAPVWNGSSPNPGARSNSYTVVDGNELVLYGGEGVVCCDPNGGGLKDGDFQDVWRFTPAADGRPTGVWRYESGPQGLDGPPHYGTRGQPSPAGQPPSEHAGLILREPFRGALWFLGGENGQEQYGMRNDLWAYNLSTKLWTWESGSAGYNGTATYGSRGLPSSANTPGARYAGQAFSADNRLWVFGGFSLDKAGAMGYMNDLWSFG